jgi:phenylalanyl-tRNA synthetase beta chain
MAQGGANAVMATVTFTKSDLEKLVGKKLTEKDYKERIPMMGTPLEGIDEENNEVDFEIFPNRPDLLAVEGFARAVQGFLDIKKGLPKYTVKKSDYEVHVDPATYKTGRACVVFAVIKNIEFTDETVAEFMQLQDKLSMTIGRRRKKCSLGTYDFDDLEFPLRYEMKPLGYKFTPLAFSNEMSFKECLEKHPKCLEYKHLTESWTEYPAYMDNKNRCMCMLPFTNAEFAKIKPETKNIFLEVTGNDWKAVTEMLNIVVTALADRGAELYEVKAMFKKDNGRGKEHITPKLEPWKMDLDLNYVNKLLDLDMKPPEVKGVLEKMRLGYENGKVVVPAYRTDIMHSIDIVEDIAIGHGYDKFEPRIPKIPTMGIPYEKYDFENRLREVLIGLGLQETVSFVLSNYEREFVKIRKTPVEFAEIMNPKTEDYTITRVSLAPSLLDTFRINASTEMPLRIFEVGKTVRIDKNSETGAVDVEKVGGAILHSGSNYSEIKAVVEAFLAAVGKKATYREAKNGLFIEGRAVEVLIGGKPAGFFGEVHPEVLQNFEIEYPVTLFEFDVEALR